MSFLYKTNCLVLFYIPTKYHQTIPEGIPVTKLTQNQFEKQKKGDNCNSEKARVVILVSNMLSCPVLHFYQVS